MTLEHQYNDRGNHRIASGDKAGEWVGYNNIATYTAGIVVYLAVTDYFSGNSGIEPDVIYQLSKTDFKSKAAFFKPSSVR